MSLPLGSKLTLADVCVPCWDGLRTLVGPSASLASYRPLVVRKVDPGFLHRSVLPGSGLTFAAAEDANTALSAVAKRHLFSCTRTPGLLAQFSDPPFNKRPDRVAVVPKNDESINLWLSAMVMVRVPGGPGGRGTMHPWFYSCFRLS